jgi:hypothetical protein
MIYNGILWGYLIRVVYQLYLVFVQLLLTIFYSSMQNCHLVLDTLCNFTIAAYFYRCMLLILINTNQRLFYVEFFFFPIFFLLCNLSGLWIEYSIAFFGSLQLILNKVLLLGSTSQTIIGRPIVPDAAVHAVVEEHVSADLPVSIKFYTCGTKKIIYTESTFSFWE